MWWDEIWIVIERVAYIKNVLLFYCKDLILVHDVNVVFHPFRFPKPMLEWNLKLWLALVSAFG